MMQNAIFKIVGVVVVAVAIAIAVAKACESEVDRINRRMDELCDLSSMSSQESNLAAGMRAKKISEFFMPGIEIRAESAPISISSRGELRRLVFQSRTQLNSIDVDARKKDTVLDESGKTARMAVSMRISARGPQGSETFREAFEIDWTKDDGEWNIQNVDRRETIRLID